MRLIRARDYDDMSLKAANIIAAQVSLNPKSVLGLAAGSGVSSPVPAANAGAGNKVRHNTNVNKLAITCLFTVAHPFFYQF